MSWSAPDWIYSRGETNMTAKTATVFWTVCGFVRVFSRRAPDPTDGVPAGLRGGRNLGPSPEALCLVTVFAWSTPVVRQDFDFRETAIKRDRKRIGELPNKPAIAAKHAEGQEL